MKRFRAGKFPDCRFQLIDHRGAGQGLVGVASQENQAGTVHAIAHSVFNLAIVEAGPQPHMGSADRRQFAHALDGFTGGDDTLIAMLERGNDRRTVTGDDLAVTAADSEIDAVQASFQRTGGFLLPEPGDKTISTDDFCNEDTKMT